MTGFFGDGDREDPDEDRELPDDDLPVLLGALEKEKRSKHFLLKSHYYFDDEFWMVTFQQKDISHSTVFFEIVVTMMNICHSQEQVAIEIKNWHNRETSG